MVDGSSSQVISFNLFGWRLYDSPGYVHHSWLCPLPHLSHPVSYWVVLTLHVLPHVCFFVSLYDFKGLLWWLSGKKSACQYSWCWLDTLIFWRPPGEGNGNPLQHSCQENPMERSLVGYDSRGLKSWAQLSDHDNTLPWNPGQQSSIEAGFRLVQWATVIQLWKLCMHEVEAGLVAKQWIQCSLREPPPTSKMSLHNLGIFFIITKNRKQGQWQHF